VILPREASSRGFNKETNKVGTMEKNSSQTKRFLDKGYIILAGLIGGSVGIFLKKYEINFFFTGLMISVAVGVFAGLLLLMVKKMR
jgi:hypothetical protein